MFLLIKTDDLGEVLRQLDRIEWKVNRIMAAVQIDQDVLDGIGGSLESLVATLNGLDLTPLPAADQSKLVAGLTDVTAAVNKVAGVTVPTPNPEPGPTDTTPAEEPPATPTE